MVAVAPQERDQAHIAGQNGNIPVPPSMDGGSCTSRARSSAHRRAECEYPSASGHGWWQLHLKSAIKRTSQGRNVNIPVPPSMDGGSCTSRARSSAHRRAECEYPSASGHGWRQLHLKSAIKRTAAQNVNIPVPPVMDGGSCTSIARSSAHRRAECEYPSASGHGWRQLHLKSAIKRTSQRRM